MSSRSGFSGNNQRHSKFAKSYKKPPPSPPLERSFAFLARIVLAVLLLPFDVLFGNCFRTGEWGRPALGLLGVGAAWGLARFVSTSGPNRGRLQQRMDPDKRKVYHPVEIPHWLNLCNLDGFPGASMVCPHDAQRIRQLYTDGAYDVSELSNGMRVLSVNGEVFSSYNTHTGRLGDEYARATVEMASTWRRVTAGGERPVRALLLGLGGGAMVSGLHHKCHARSSFRHRRASTGVQGCVITAVEIDPNMVRIARQLFLGVDGAGADMGAGIADGMANENAVKFVIADATNYVLHDAQEGGFDVVINDVYDQQGVMPPRLRDARFYGDVRRLLGAGGIYIVNAIAPAWGPGTGRGDLSVAVAAMCEAFGKENVEVKRTGPFLPGFPQNQLVVGTKRLDKKVSEYYNLA